MTTNAFIKTWEFITTLAVYVVARYKDAGIKVAANFGDAWNLAGFCSGLAEIVFITGLIIFTVYLIFWGFQTDRTLHIVLTLSLIGLAVVTCLG